MKKLLLVLVWAPTTLVLLFLSLVLLYTGSNTKNRNSLLSMQAREMLPYNGYQFYAALPHVLGIVSSTIAKEDARPEIIHQFLTKYSSPLLNHAELIVQVSDAYSLDFRLIPAIGMCESNLGKKIPEGSFNAWGFQIYTGQSNGATFEGWDHSIRTMGEYLYTKFYSKGLISPEDIGPIYAPPSIYTDNSWAKCVRTFMEELI